MGEKEEKKKSHWRQYKRKSIGREEYPILDAVKISIQLI